MENYQPKFSVITATFNMSYVLWKAIQSVLEQTYPFFELIIVDDNSSDDTEKLIKEFSDPRIVYIKNKNNIGPAGARNIGLKKARGEWIAYLDSDNTWHREFLEVMNDAKTREPERVLFFCKKNYRLSIIDEKGERVNLRDEFSNHKKHFDLKRLWHRRIMIDTNTMCHKRDEIVNLGGWDESLDFWEDWDLTLRISIEHPDGILYLNRALLDYEQTLDIKKAEEIFSVWEKAEEKIFKKYEGHPLLEGQTWFPPEKGNKSTLGVIDFLKSKHKNK
ncbi:hypothetical protein C0583_05495 [Candidatus Parcubacteria bacterium]|nr:MAG: hypothetical protein C0583_05495 [Candidatus Parcubacteria bacterium]